MSDLYAQTVEPEDEGFAGDADETYRIRVMTPADVDALVSLDAKQTGSRRTAYYEEKLTRCVEEPKLNTSLLAESDGLPVGFLIGRLFFGEFGIPAPRAVLDTLGVHPNFRHQRVAEALMSQFRKNMEGLRVRAIDTLVDWDRFDLAGFFKKMGFHPSRAVDLVWHLKRYPFAGGDGVARIRPATADDLETIALMDGEVLGERRGTYFEAKWDTAKAHPERTSFLVAEVEDELAGFLISDLYRGEFGIEVARGVIDTIGVRERFQHQGVASSLVNHLVGWLEKNGVEQMQTLCRWNDWDLLPFFEYVGFRPSFRVNLELVIG